MYLSIICGMFGPQEIIIILVIVLLLFGGRKIPELMKGLGKGMKEFKKATNEDDDDQPSDKKETEKINK
ncbi:twin-arginine translocase TatA/TatE family subunit [Sunxiuqinia elliptica]|uniref:Sec-independent protein translocase protein TatA n=1 Tax=Sunxiuqinia elliptica TaxID=655355 RepID=A0A1I2C0Q7_9BACT|nr:twin-arginine translocase TatA/TatE family subunit [Sunxiuqinia elliptica]TDO03753.1 sec-independent protein translocase protein TatA [Sunxiuqinia elliptica]TDO62034.1 sec-independent protein translocase protein TatA [Sunxiuqinia elliptica]SFE62026.1 sec-independent protein translocase protein TatA [Sunxiuqinia elliptica]